MSWGLLFPGQGTQHPGMLPWLEAAPAAAGACAELVARLGADWRGRLADTGWADRNAVAQPLLAGVCLAGWEALRADVPAPAVVAGYSVGEIASFCAAGVFDVATAMRIATLRAAAMDRCARGGAAGMMGVSDLDAVAAAALARQHGLGVAIRLSADQCVLGGAAVDLDRAAKALSALGARCKRLAIGVASHTPAMAGATAALREALAAIPFGQPAALVVCDATGRVERDVAALKKALAAQVSQTIPWDVCMDTMAERGVRCVLEMGPGTALSRLWNARHPGVPARAIDDFRSPASAAAWVRRALD